MLLNGHRVAPNNQDGSVNIDVMPQMMVERVDIVTGGASAIYGSDAVAGVVNYILDKDFTGLSVKADYGMSKYSDGDQYQLGAAWGTACSPTAAISKSPHAFVIRTRSPSASAPMARTGRPGS